MAPFKRGKEFIIRVEEDAKKKAVALSQRYDLPMKEVLTRLIDFCMDYDLITPGWEKRLPILVEKDVKDKAIVLSQRYKLPLRAVVSTLVDLCADYDLLKPGWEERLNAAMDKGEIKIQKKRYAELDDPCPGMFFADEVWKCLWAREGKPPQIKKLAKDISDALNACASCDKTRKIIKQNLELLNKVSKLESKLENGRAREEHTYCKDGGWYDDKTGRINCKKMDVWQDQDRCFTMWNGKPCPSLRTLPARRVKRTGIRRRKR